MSRDAGLEKKKGFLAWFVFVERELFFHTAFVVSL